MGRASVAAILAVLAAAASPAGAQPEGERIFTQSGYVDLDDGGSGDSFGLLGEDARFLLPPGPHRDMYRDILEESVRSGVALEVRFDGTAGRLDGAGEHVVYPLCSIGTFSGAHFGDDEANCPPRPGSAATAERLLALGLAQAQDWPEAARRSLSQALSASPALPQRAQAMAHNGRARAAELLSRDRLPGEERDRLLLDALADYRRVAALQPDDIHAQQNVAYVLRYLGAYEEALEAYRQLATHSPEASFRAAVQTAAVYREQGDAQSALRLLDELARQRPGQAEGMMFRYHRGWTLSLLRRFAEARDEIDAGLTMQPDYAFGYRLRSCARSQLGDLEGALADADQAIELLVGLTDRPDRELRTDIGRSREAAAALRRAIAEGRRGPVGVVCETFWASVSGRQGRSPLFPRGAGRD